VAVHIFGAVCLIYFARSEYRKLKRAAEAEAEPEEHAMV